jgi:CheY-like chemotaxis protein
MMPILLVDDETQVRRLIKTILVQQGFEIVEAEDGLGAFSTIQELKGRLSLIVSDVRMPRLDGISLCKRVRKRFPHIPVLLYSGDAPEACQVGDRFLQKPVHPDVLICAVRDLVSNAL